VANHNPNLAKINRNYTVSEVATLYGISKATVRRWIRLGLPVIDDMRPILILGCDLLDYIHRQRRSVVVLPKCTVVSVVSQGGLLLIL